MSISVFPAFREPTIPFDDIIASDYESDSELFPVKSDMGILSPWAMNYLPESTLDAEDCAELFAQFWWHRLDIMFMPEAFLGLHGIMREHPDFPDGLVLTGLKIVRLTRVKRQSIPLPEYGQATIDSVPSQNAVLAPGTDPSALSSDSSALSSESLALNSDLSVPNPDLSALNHGPSVSNPDLSVSNPGLSASNPGLLAPDLPAPVRIAHDLLIATTAEGAEFGLYSDNAARLGLS